MFSKKEIGIALAYLVIAILLFRDFLFTQSVMGFRHDWNIPVYDEQIYQWITTSLYFWSSSDLGVNLFYQTDAILKFIIYPFYLVGLNNGYILSSTINILPIFISGLSLYYLGRILGIKEKYSFFAGIFYMLSPIVFNRVVGGHYYVVLSYALSPLIIGLFIRYSNSDSNSGYKTLIVSGLLLALAGTQIQFLVMIPAMLFIYLLFAKNVIKGLKSSIVIISIAFLMHMYWILPSVFNVNISNTLHYAADMSWIRFNSPSFTSILRLVLDTGGSPYFFRTIQNISWTNGWMFISFIIPFVAFSACIFRPKDKNVLYFSLISAVALFLGKGLNPPLGSINIWLSNNFSLMSMFRDLYEFGFVIALGYAILIGITFQEIFEKLDNRFKNSMIITIASDVIVLLIIIIYLYPILTGNFSDQVQIYKFPIEYKQVYDNFSHRNDDFRILWLPMIQPIQYNNLTYPGVDPLISFSPKSSFSQQTSTSSYSGVYNTFIVTIFQQDRTMYIGELLRTTNTKYIIFRDNFISKYPDFVPMNVFPSIKNIWTNKETKKILDNQSDLSLDGNIKNISIYENEKFVPHIYSEEPTLIVGDLSTLVSLNYLNSSVGSSFIFASQISSENIDFLNNNINKVVIDEYDDDFLTPFIKKEYVINPSLYVQENDAFKGWSRSSNWWWYDWHFASQLNDGIFTFEQDISINIPFKIKRTDEYEIWVKMSSVGQDDQNGIVEISLNNKTLSEETSKGLKYHFISSLKLRRGEYNLKINNIQGKNLISYIIIAPKDVIENATEQRSNFLKNKDIIIIKELEDVIFKKDIYKELAIDDSWNFDQYQYDFVMNQSYHDIDYSFDINDNITNVKTRFTGDNNVDEFVIITKQIRYDLNEYPFFSIDYKVENPNMQFIQLGLGTDFDDDGIADKNIFLSPEIPSRTKMGTFTTNFLENIKDIYPDKKNYKIVSMTVLAHKSWKTASINKNTSFYFGNIKIYDSGSKKKLKLTSNFSQGEYSYIDYEPFYANVSIDIPINGRYDILVRASGNSTVGIGYDLLKLSDLMWYDLGEKDLNEGLINFNITSQDQKGNATSINSTIFEVKSRPIGQPIKLDELVLVKTRNRISKYKDPTLSFQKIDPTKYIVQVNGTTSFDLFFSESFDKGWKAFVNGNNDEQIQEEYHFVANGFANGWYVNSTGNYSIVLEYIPQRLYNVGLVISASTFIILILILIYCHHKI